MSKLVVHSSIILCLALPLDMPEVGGSRRGPIKKNSAVFSAFLFYREAFCYFQEATLFQSNTYTIKITAALFFADFEFVQIMLTIIMFCRFSSCLLQPYVYITYNNLLLLCRFTFGAILHIHDLATTPVLRRE